MEEPCYASTYLGNSVSDNWSNATEWSGGVPNSIDASANLANSVPHPGVPLTITVDSSITLGSLIFNATGNTYTLSPDGVPDPLIFNASSGSPTISVSALSPNINCPIQITGGQNLTITPVTSLNINGVISQTSPSGVLNVSGTGTVTLGAANTYTGGTSISGGSTLAFISGGGLYSAGSVTVTGAGSTFNPSGAGGTFNIGNIFAGTGTTVNIHGINFKTTVTSPFCTIDTLLGNASSSFTSTGPGTLTITGNGSSDTFNFSSGHTIINGNLTSSISSLSAMVTVNGNLVGNFDVSDSGTLIVNGSVGSSLFVNNFGLITGTGTLFGDVINNTGATIAPGNPIGTLTVNGFLNNSAGSSINIEINPTSASKIQVMGSPGNANVTGATLNVTLEPNPFYSSTTFDIMTATGTITSPFAAVNIINPLAMVTVNYGTNLISLSLTGFADFTTVVTQGNATKVAACADASTALAGSDFDNILNDLTFLTTDGLYAAFNQMQPTAFKAFAVSQQNIFLEVENALSHRYHSFFKTSCSQKEPIGKPTLWFDVFGSTQTQDGKVVAPFSPEPSFTTKTGGALLGIDQILTKNFGIGVCTGYSIGDLSMHANAGHGNIQSVYLGPYIKFGHENEDLSPYLTASLLGEFNWYNTHRNIIFPGVNRTANSSHCGGGFLFQVGAATWITAGKFDISPFGNFDVIYMRENSYTESGADSLNLHVNASNYQFNQFEFGALIRRCIRISQGLLIPKISLSGIRENRSHGSHYTASLAGSNSCEFTVKGYYPDRILFVPAAELKGLFLKEKFSASLYYQGKFGSSFSQNELGLQFAWNF